MMPSLFTSKRWNDENVLTHTSVKLLLAQWDAIEHEGDNNKAEMRILRGILKCRRDAHTVRVWLQQAFQPNKPEPDLNAVKIYLNYLSKLKAKDGSDFRYLNDERAKLKLGHFLDSQQSRIVPPVTRRLAPNLRFKKTSTNTKASLPTSTKYDEYGETTGTVKLQPTTQGLGVTVRLDETGSSSAAIPEELASILFVESEDMAEETVFSQIDAEGEPLPSQNCEGLCGKMSNPQDGPFDASPETDTPDSKWEGLVHHIHSSLHIGDAHPDPVGYLDQTHVGGVLVATGDHDIRQVDQIPPDGPRRTKRRKFDPTPIVTMADCETRSLPHDPSSVSNDVPCIPQGEPARSSQPKRVGPASHPLQDGGILDVCYHPSSDHNHLDIPDGAHLVIMESEGGQQAQDSQPTNEDLELVTLDSKHQSSMAMLDSEGPREVSSCHTSSVPMGDSSNSLHSNFTDNLTVQPPPKAKLPKLPPIWAESRQEVCEAFDWFRSYQGGVYHTDHTVKGYLLSAFASKRDVFENGGRLIISHGGGKSESIGCQKGLFVSHQASDQLADDKSVRALLDNYRSGRPLVLIVDDKYARFPFDLSSKRVTYAVLGFYSIVYAWAEFETAKNEVGRVIRYKFAFRWCEEQGPPWWWCFADETGGVSKALGSDKVKGSSIPRIVSENDFSRKRPPKSTLQKIGVCSFCGSFSHQVYSTWVCLTTNCEMFWKNPGTMELAPESLEYHKEFFALLPRLALPSGLNLMPETTLTRAMNGTSTSYAFTRGIHCPRCGRLSSRYQWEQLECRACNKWIKKADIDVRSAEGFWGDRLPITFEHFQMSAVSDFVPGPVQTFKHEGGRGAIQTFTLPYNRGYIHHIRTPSATGMLEADKIFKHYQEEAKSGTIRFRRWPLKAHKCRGTLLTNYFSHNAGEPYQYVGSDANTVPFEQVPAVTEARQLIQDRILQSLGRIPEFNEVLSCAYMERQKMAFHSDAEVGLGPLVASLSLGSPALMHFRIVARHDPLYERRGVLLTVVLRHGDVLVMDGNEVQEYYEHTVVPNNFRIAATARQITPKHRRQE